MGEPELKRMSADEFLVWQLSQEQNYELVDGLPVLPLKAMTGASRAYDRVVVRVLAELLRQLDGSRCEPTTDDIAVGCRLSARAIFKGLPFPHEPHPCSAIASSGASPRSNIP